MNVLDLLKSRGIEPCLATRGRAGEEYWSPCPSCGGDDRFHVWPEEKGNGAYWCRQCGRWGDDVQFRVDFMGMDYPAAFADAGRERPLDYKRPAPRREKPVFQPRAVADPDADWQRQARKLVHEAHQALLDNPAQLRWLRDKRGITQDTVQQFQLGTVAGENNRNCRFRSRQAWGLPEIKRDNGRPKALWIPRGLLIPYITGDTVQRIRIRRPKVDCPSKKDVRFYVLPGSAMMPMAIASDQRAAAVVESELDAILVAQDAGDRVASIALGSSSARPDQAVWPILKKALCILVALDFDQAGAKAWRWWQDQFARARRWPVPQGKDPGEAWAGGVDLKAWISAGLPPACRLGPSVLTGDDKGAAAKDPDGDPETPSEKTAAENGPETACPDVAETVTRLYGLLCDVPRIRIRATADQVQLLHVPYRIDDTFRGVSRLVYSDAACWDYLQAHPADVIGADNFYQKTI